MENNQQQKDKFFTKLKYIIINYPIIECIGWIIAWYPAYSISAALLYILPGFAQFCYIIDALQKLLNIHFVEPIDKEIMFIIVIIIGKIFIVMSLKFKILSGFCKSFIKRNEILLISVKCEKKEYAAIKKGTWTIIPSMLLKFRKGE